MTYLLQSVRVSLADIPPDSIIFARELSASEAAEARSDCVSAFVCEMGSSTSHAAIVARAKGIPFITNINLAEIEPNLEHTIIVDGQSGTVIVSPTSNTLRQYRRAQSQLKKRILGLGATTGLNAETYDGHAIRLSANVEMVQEAESVHEYGGSGIGLFRSEYTCVAKDTFPTEEEQFETYRTLVQKMRGLPVVIRTFDVGGDKFLLNRQAPPEENPFLGCRAIRFMLKESHIFKAQLRAILRSSAFGDVRIMFPMVSSLGELFAAKKCLAEARQELESEGVEIPACLPIGCMIEVPSAALICDLLAKECDFLSIGTNDLVQYALAVDRSNHAMSEMYTPTHPSVLRLIKLVVHEANRHGIPVSVCGEVAADPRYTPLLIGLGVQELSVASRYIPVVKQAIRNLSIIGSLKLAEKALNLSSSEEIDLLLNENQRSKTQEECFYT